MRWVLLEELAILVQGDQLEGLGTLDQGVFKEELDLLGSQEEMEVLEDKVLKQE